VADATVTDTVRRSVDSRARPARLPSAMISGHASEYGSRLGEAHVTAYACGPTFAIFHRPTSPPASVVATVERAE
jgi:hypothetical protein